MEEVFRSPVEEKQLVAAYLVHKRLWSLESHKKKEIAEKLDFEKAEEYYGQFPESSAFFEFLCWFLLGSRKPYNKINAALENSGIHGWKLTNKELDDQHPYKYAQASYESLINIRYSDRKTWKPLFTKISESSSLSCRFIAHFLLPFSKFLEVSSRQSYKDATNVIKLNRVLEEWINSTDPEFHKWWLLKSILQYVGEAQATEEIEKEYRTKCKNGNSDGECGHASADDCINLKIDAYTNTSDHQVLLNNALAIIPCKDHVYIKESGLSQPTKTMKTVYQKKCLEYIDDLFKWQSNGELHTSEQYPPEHMMKTEASEAAKCFKKLYVDDKCFIITHYSSEQHLKFLQFSKEQVCQTLSIDSIADWKQRFLYFNFSKNIVMNVRVCDQSSVDSALHASLEDLILFLFLHLNLRLDVNTRYVASVIAPNLSKSNNRFVFTKTDVSKTKKLRTKMQSFLGGTSAANNEVFRLLIASVIGGLAVTLEESFIPSLYGTSSSRVMFVHFTAEQLRIVYSACKWMIIKGGYGSGKSLIGWYIAKMLAESACKPTIIYYICFDENTMLCEKMLQIGENLSSKHVQVIAGYAIEIFSKLSANSSVSMTVSSLLQAILKNHSDDSKSYHVIIDELDCEMINTIQADTLRETFDNALVSGSKLKEAYVVFLARSLEKLLTYVEGTTSFQHDSYHSYSDERCGMVVEELSYCMRMSKQCFDVVSAVATVIMEKESIINHPKNSSQLSVDMAMIAEPAEPVSPSADVTLDLRPNILRSASTTMPTHHHGDSELDFQTSNEETSLSGLASVNSDELFSLAKKMNPDQVNEDVRTETRFDFNLSKDTGHSVLGNKAKLIFLFYGGESYRMETAIARLGVALEAYCFHRDNFTENCSVLMVGSLEEIGLFKNAMKLIDETYAAFYPGYKLEFDTLEDLKERVISNQGNNFISTVAGCRGMEYPWVIASVNPNDHFERQLFVEAISRCTGQLLLVVPYTLNERVPSERASMYDVLLKLKDARTDSGETLLDVVHFRYGSDKEQLYLDNKTVVNSNFYEVHEYARKAKQMFHTDVEEFDQTSMKTSEVFMRYSRPSKVVDVSCSYISRNECMLTWKGGLHQYRVYKRSLNDDDDDMITVDAQTGGRFTCMIADLDPQTTYEFKIDCINSCGLQSDPYVVQYSPRILVKVSQESDEMLTLKLAWNKQLEVVESVNLDGEDVHELVGQQTIEGYLHLTIPGVQLNQEHNITVRLKVSDSTGHAVIEDYQLQIEIPMRGPGMEDYDEPDISVDLEDNQHLPDAYRMQSRPRGLCIIINNDRFNKELHLFRREGADVDVESLRRVMERLDFVVEIHMNLTLSNLTEVISEVTRRDHSEYDCFITCLLSHGYDGGIYTTDGQQFSFTTLISYFDANHFPTMISKPKLVFVQACQGGEMDTDMVVMRPDSSRPRTVEFDGPPHKPLGKPAKEATIARLADIFVFVAATPGHVAWRNAISGSWFIQVFCQVLADSKPTWSLHDIVLEVNRIIAEKEATLPHSNSAKQMSNVVCNTLRKKLYFKQTDG